MYLVSRTEIDSGDELTFFQMLCRSLFLKEDDGSMVHSSLLCILWFISGRYGPPIIP